jgi:hypothetical protein
VSEPTARLEWNRGNRGKVLIDGQDVAGSVRRATLTLDGSEAPRLVLELDVLDVAASTDDEPQLVLGPKTDALLDRAGWRSPEQIQQIIGQLDAETTRRLLLLRQVEDLIAERDRLFDRLAMTCGSCHPCSNWDAEVMRRLLVEVLADDNGCHLADGLRERIGWALDPSKLAEAAGEPT